MKIIIAGSTGRLATGLIRNALANPSVTSVVALGRRAVDVNSLSIPNATPTLPSSSNTGPTSKATLNPGVVSGSGVVSDVSKLKSVVVQDFMNYDDIAKKELSAADAVIWTIAITPSKLKTVPWEESCRVCRDFPLYGIETISKLPRGEGQGALRFVYLSGQNAERDQGKRPWLLADYGLMRGDAEAKILKYATESNDVVEGYVAKVGLITDARTDSYLKGVGSMLFGNMIGIGTVDIDVISIALLDQAMNGFEKETLINADVVRIGLRVMAEKGL